MYSLQLLLRILICLATSGVILFKGCAVLQRASGEKSMFGCHEYGTALLAVFLEVPDIQRR